MKPILATILIIFTSLLFMKEVEANEVTFQKITFNKSQVYILKTSLHKISVGFTLKNTIHGINCSFYNLKTNKTVPANLYNRPFLVFNENGLINISDNKEDILENNTIVSAGSWLTKNGLNYNTNDRFNDNFKNILVKRTCLGLDKDNNVYLIVATNANFNKLRNIGKNLKLVTLVNLDGGESSTFKYNNKILIGGGRKTPNYIIIK